MAKNFAFIDGSKLHCSIKKDLGWNLDNNKFRRYLTDKYSVSIAYYFMGYHSKYEYLYYSLKRAGYELVFKPTTIKPDGEIKGNVDSDMVFSIRDKADEFDNAIIVAGDGDYLPIIDYLKNNNKLLRIIIPNKNSYSALLRHHSQYFDYISDLKNKLEYIKKTRIV